MFRITLTLVLACTAGLAAKLTAQSSFVAPLTAERLLPAMQQALGDIPAQIDIVDFSRFPAPEGAVEFSLKDLNPPASLEAATRWRGFVLEEDGRKFSIWAIVKIKAECTRVIARELLEVGQPIVANQIREETYQGFPFVKNSLVTLTDIVGRAPLRTIQPGAFVRRDATVEPLVVAGGSDVIAEFRSGPFRITAAVVALGSGRVGDMVAVRNPSSKKIFRARVIGPGHVIVEMAQ